MHKPEFLINRELMSQLYPSFSKGLAPFFSGHWGEYSDFLTFKGGLNPVTGGLWLSDIAHHHLALAVLFIFAGHMYRTNWGIGHSMKEILEAHKGPFTGEGHKGIYEILTTSWHAQLAINLAMMGSLSIIVAHHMYAMPPYPYIATDYATQLSLFTHHMWIGGFCVVGGAAHAAIFMVRDYTPANNYNNLLDRVLRHRDSIISHLNWVCIFLGCHAFGFYVHNDTMRALGRPQDVFSDKAIQLQPIFAQWIQNIHLLAPGTTAPNALATTSYAFGGDVVEVGGKIAMMPIKLGTADFMVHHIHAFTIHVTVLILLKGVLYARSSKLIPDKANLGFRFPCDGPGRGGTCQSSSWDHVFLGLFCSRLEVFLFSVPLSNHPSPWATHGTPLSRNGSSMREIASRQAWPKRQMALSTPQHPRRVRQDGVSFMLIPTSSKSPKRVVTAQSLCRSTRPLPCCRWRLPAQRRREASGWLKRNTRSLRGTWPWNPVTTP
jgi:photosystem I P700 chlorophyll a apoprotein A1